MSTRQLNKIFFSESSHTYKQIYPGILPSIQKEQHSSAPQFSDESKRIEAFHLGADAIQI